MDPLQGEQGRMVAGSALVGCCRTIGVLLTDPRNLHDLLQAVEGTHWTHKRHPEVRRLSQQQLRSFPGSASFARAPGMPAQMAEVAI